MKSIATKIIVLGVLASVASGCVLAVGAAAGAGGYVYYAGKEEAMLDAPVGTVHIAARNALKDLGLPIDEDKVDISSGKLKSHYADGKTIWIDIDKETGSSSKIVVRVSAKGDEERATEILTAIKNNL